MTYDLSLYLCANPSTSAWMLNSGENCFTERDANGYTRFLKNGHYETLWNDGQYVFRGIDTSSLPNEIYAQFTGDTYGAIWMKRTMNIGDVTERNPDIRFYNADGQETHRAPGGMSWLWLRKHDDSLTFPETGATVQDVVTLEWTSDAAGQQVIERYFYGRGLGLVGFDFFGEPQLHTRYSGLTAVHPTFTPFPNFVEPVPPPTQDKPLVITTPPPAGLANPVATTIALSAGLNLRATPHSNGAKIRTMPKGEHVTFYSTPLSDSGDYVFCYGKDALGNTGYSAIAVNGQPSFNPPVGLLMPAPTFRLKNPVGCAHVISSKYGVPRDYDGDGVSDDIHEGLDITRAHPDCTPLILAAAAGVIDDVSSVGDYGNHVKVKTTVGTQVYVLWYCHLMSMFVVEGQQVKAGDPIGVMGTTGNSTGVHLHLNCQKIGAATPPGSPVASVIDPEPLIDW